MAERKQQKAAEDKSEVKDLSITHTFQWKINLLSLEENVEFNTVYPKYGIF